MAAPLPEFEVRSAMLRVEALLAQFGIDVAGYGQSQVPQAETVSPDHPYIQGNDGGYVDGHVYINDEALSACVGLTLVHELVHDATLKQRLFATVSNDRVEDMFEALADAITQIAAQDPYLPGCLPRRHFSIDRDELVSLANGQNPAPPGLTPIRSSIDTPIPAWTATLSAPTQPEAPAEGLAMLRCRGLLGDTCIALPPPL